MNLYFTLTDFMESTEINNATFSIKMPKEFDESELKNLGRQST